MSYEQQPLLPSSYTPEQREQTDQPPTSRPETWRSCIAEALESTAVHKLVITLIVIDAVCVLVDLAYTVLSPECEPEGAPDAPEWLEVLSLISTVITTLFLVEIPLTLWAFGREFYNPFGRIPHSSLHLFDATIILTTFTLEVILRGKERELAGLLITLRLWRLLKLVGGVAVGAGEIEEETYKELARVKNELRDTRLSLTQAQDESRGLRERIELLESQTSATST